MKLFFTIITPLLLNLNGANWFDDIHTSTNNPVNQLTNLTTNIIGYSRHDLNIYPNPANDLMVIDFPSYSSTNFSTVEISGIDGRLFMKKSMRASKTLFDISELPAGVYVIKAAYLNKFKNIFLLDI